MKTRLEIYEGEDAVLTADLARTISAKTNGVGARPRFEAIGESSSREYNASRPLPSRFIRHGVSS